MNAVETTGRAGAPSVAERARLWLASNVKERGMLLLGLIVVLLVVMAILDGVGMTSGRFDSDYLASTLIAYVPLALLALAELVVITSGKGGIDLSVGAMVSLCGIVFGMLYQQAGLPLPLAVLLAVVTGTLLGAVNGYLTAYVGFPALITTLATFYAYRSLALVVSNQKPISGDAIRDLYGAAKAVEIPLIGGSLPLVPLGVFTFLLPVAVAAWFLLNRTTYGRRLYAIGTNDTAAQWAGIDTRRTRMLAYTLAGSVSGLVAVYTVAQFASARPDAGTSGPGMALPAITIAVLGGVAITGGIGRLSGILLSALLIVWLNAAILLVVPGNDGAQVQLLALGLVLVGSALLSRTQLRRKAKSLPDAAPAAPRAGDDQGKVSAGTEER
ncbi:ABC transporter permease [Microbacterium sp.]|uniref:ABC transporter permease n=1 Tax=Microbacterium sp. TaxID=51671 RepID=UPI0039E312B7